MNSEDIRTLIGAHATVLGVDLKDRFAFVQVPSKSAAKDCISALHKTDFRNKVISIEIASGRGYVKRREQQRRDKAVSVPNKTIFVAKLNFGTSEAVLRAAFAKFGEITRLEVKRNFGFVAFEDIEHSKAVMHRPCCLDLIGLIGLIF